MRLALLVLVALLAACGGAGSGERAPAARTIAAKEHVLPPARPFVPPTHREGEKVVMPVVFPDGTTAELVHPRELELAERGVRPSTSGAIAGCCAVDFPISYGGVLPGLFEIEGSRPLAVYRKRGRKPVELWRTPSESDVHGYLVFAFGPWRVFVRDDGLSEEEIATWVRRLDGRVTDRGFLVLDARPPLRLARFAEHAGPELMLSSSGGEVLVKTGRWADDVKGASPNASRDFSSWYFPAADLSVHVYFRERDFLQAVFDGLEVRNVRRASG